MQILLYMGLGASLMWIVTEPRLLTLFTLVAWVLAVLIYKETDGEN